MNIKKLFFLSILTSLNFLSYSQLRKVFGQVVDQQNRPISFATIKFKGGTKQYYVMTHENGRYYGIIDSQHDSIVICSHANFKTVSKKIEGNNQINFVLDKDMSEYKLNPIVDTIINVKPDRAESRFVDSFALENEDRIFTSVEIQPEFTGGSRALQKYFFEKLKIANVGRIEHLDGVVRAIFTVDKDGNISAAGIEKGVDEAIDQLILKLITQMPKWRPAMQNGRYCEGEVMLSIPIKRIVE